MVCPIARPFQNHWQSQVVTWEKTHGLHVVLRREGLYLLVNLNKKRRKHNRKLVVLWWFNGILRDLASGKRSETMENHDFFHGKTHYFDWAMFSGHATNYQGLAIENGYS